MSQDAQAAKSSLAALENAPPQDKVAALIKHGVAEGASDLHLRAGDHPRFRVDGELYPDTSLRMTEGELVAYFKGALKSEQFERFVSYRELDCSHTLEGVCRMRVNLYRQQEAFAAAIRILPGKIPTMKEIYLTKACYQFTTLHKGLVLVTGPTGSGKSTTLAAMIDHVNQHRRCHILTLEDPVEYRYESKLAMVSQRELAIDTLSFEMALRHSFRQDPDVILLGEMRDQESMQMAITLAETGHLTFSTLHTAYAAQTINRIVDNFPPHQVQQIRNQLSISLQGIISQQLLPIKDRRGRVAAREILVGVPSVRNLIREGKTAQISSAIQTGVDVGMVPLNFSLGHLYKTGIVAYETALAAAYDRQGFEHRYGPAPGGPTAATA